MFVTTYSMQIFKSYNVSIINASNYVWHAVSSFRTGHCLFADRRYLSPSLFLSSVCATP